MIDLPADINQAYAAKEVSSGQLVGGPSRTVGQNIQDRIRQHEEAIAKLKKVYDTLQSGTILDVNLSDLQQAMRW